MLQTQKVACDVLVVGGGITAALAAIKAREYGADVLLVDKVFFGRGGCSSRFREPGSPGSDKGNVPLLSSSAERRRVGFGRNIVR